MSSTTARSRRVGSDRALYLATEAPTSALRLLRRAALPGGAHGLAGSAVPLAEGGGDMCLADERHRKEGNCAGRLRCLFGMGESGNATGGIWAARPAALEALGPDPRLLRRDPAMRPAGLVNGAATCYLNTLFQVS